MKAWTIFVVIISAVVLISMMFFISNLKDSVGSGLKDITGKEKNFCTPESREAETCKAIYEPVCGWFNPEKIQCIKYPCAQTYSNTCAACMNEDVLYWTEGLCPIG